MSFEHVTNNYWYYRLFTCQL